MKQLSQVDSMFVYLENQETTMHISPILVYEPSEDHDNPVRFKDILKRFQERIYKSPVFRQKLVKVPFNLDNPYWIEDDNFDLEFHVRHLAIPKPGDWRQLYILLARLHSRPINLKRPPWEAYVIEGLDNATGLPSGSFVLYMKIHHSAIDGATGNQIIEALHDFEPYPAAHKNKDIWKGERRPSTLELIGKAYVNNVVKSPKRIKRFANLALNKLTGGDDKIFDKQDLQDHKLKYKTRFNGDVSPRRVFGGYRMDLSDLKFIKNTVGECTLNDVFLCIVGGAMRQYLLDKNELHAESLVTMVPISTRSVDQSNVQGGNEVSGMRLLLRTDIADPVERLKLIHADAVSSKAYSNAIGAQRISSIINSIPASIASIGMKVATTAGLNSKSPMAHTVVTNVPGSQQPIYLCGAKARLWFGAGCLLDGSALFHTVNSYYGSVCITYLCCRDIMPDPEVYHHCISGSFNELLEGAKVLEKEQEKRVTMKKKTVRKKVLAKKTIAPSKPSKQNLRRKTKTNSQKRSAKTLKT